MNAKNKISVVMVCMGNICRSPTADGVFQKHVADAGLSKLIDVDSAGTHAYHVGEPADPRAQRAAQNRGYDLSGIRARKAVPGDFELFDYVIAMDNDNYHGLQSICPVGYEGRLSLFMSFAPGADVDEVPDPYYGGPLGFERVLDLVEAASIGLLQHIKSTHQFT